jgi:cytochrome c oxidase assembly protein subunit 15
MALATYGVLLWTGLDLLRYPHEPPRYAAEMKGALRHASRLRVGGIALTGLTALTVVSGALVAGNDAGRAYNTFPKMDGRWVPDGLAELQPASRNLTENTALVQWNHRVLATATALTAAGVAAVGGFGLAGPLSPAAGRAAAAAASVVAITPQVRRGLAAVGAAAAGQYALGVATLLHCVPLPLAAAHQLGSIALFSSAIYLVHSLRYARPALVRAAKDLPRAASKVAS